jgi:hypothetical protein
LYNISIYRHEIYIFIIIRGDESLNVEERLALLEFQVELLFNNSGLDRFLYETNVNREQYRAIMDLMDVYCEKIGKGEKVSNRTFEQKIYDLIPDKHGDYRFCETIAQCFMEESRWEEVFPALYGDMPKFKGLQPKE